MAFYRGADCCVLVYDVNVIKSFDTLDNWHEEFLKQVGNLSPVGYLVPSFPSAVTENFCSFIREVTS